MSALLKPPYEGLQIRSTDSMAEVSETGSISGIANRLGDIDSYSTVADPESITPELLEEWVRMGTFLGCHEHRSSPIGFIKSAKVEGRDLMFEAEYHSTEKGQEFRTIAKERFEAKKTVAFSLGFNVSNWEWFPNGKKMIETLALRQRDLTKFNVDQISAYEQEVWLMRLSGIGEVSQVNWASNKASEATAVRGVEIEEQTPPAEAEEAKQAREKALSEKFDRHDAYLKRKVKR